MSSIINNLEMLEIIIWRWLKSLNRWACETALKSLFGHVVIQLTSTSEVLLYSNQATSIAKKLWRSESRMATS